jgi:hypothetical protein
MVSLCEKLFCIRGFSPPDNLACSRPVPYDCMITPRFPEVLSILAEERERFEG